MNEGVEALQSLALQPDIMSFLMKVHNANYEVLLPGEKKTSEPDPSSPMKFSAVHRTEEHVKLYQRGDAISKSKLWGPLRMSEAVSSTNKMQKKKREMDSYRIKTTSAIHQPVSASCITQGLFIYGIGNFKMLFKFS